MLISATKGVKFYQKSTIDIEADSLEDIGYESSDMIPVGLSVEPARTPGVMSVPLSVVKGEELALAVDPGTLLKKNEALALSVSGGCSVYSPVDGFFESVEQKKIPGLGTVPCAVIKPLMKTVKSDTTSYDGFAPIGKALSLAELIETAKKASITDETDGIRLYLKLQTLLSLIRKEENTAQIEKETDFSVLDVKAPPEQIVVKTAIKKYVVAALAVDNQPGQAAESAMLFSYGKEIAESLKQIVLSNEACSGCVISGTDHHMKRRMGKTLFDIPVIYAGNTYPVYPAIEEYLENVNGIGIGAGALLALYRAITTGQPQTGGIVTVGGDGLRAPSNLEAPFGVPVTDLLSQCGAYGTIQRVVAGGLMTGRTISPESPLSPAITSLTTQAKELNTKPSPCTRCGRCAEACPSGLSPHYLYKAVKKKEFELLPALCGDECIGCGCCSYVCPSHLPLTPLMKKIKKAIDSGQVKAPKSHGMKKKPNVREAEPDSADKAEPEADSAADHAKERGAKVSAKR